jgi:hypothetical protein
VLTATRTDENVQANGSVTASFDKNMDPYDEWLASFVSMSPSENQAPDADPDGDGLANAIEFVIGRDPTLSSPAQVLVTNVTETHVIFQFQRMKNAGAAGFVSSVEICDHLDPAIWTTVTGNALSIEDHGDRETVKASVSRVGTNVKFARLKVVAPR